MFASMQLIHTHARIHTRSHARTHAHTYTHKHKHKHKQNKTQYILERICLEVYAKSASLLFILVRYTLLTHMDI